MISVAVASPVLIKKLQCISETRAPPICNPRHPAASISCHAFMPGGLQKVEPLVRLKVKLQPRQRPTRHLLSVALHLQELLSSNSTIKALHAQDRPAATKTERAVGAEVVLHVRPGAEDAHRHRSETTTNRKRCTLSRETNFSPIYPDRPFPPPPSTATLS